MSKGTPMIRTRNLGDAGRFSCTWTTRKSLLEELISAYSMPAPPPPPPSSSQAPPPLLILPKMDVLNNGMMLCRFFDPVVQKFKFVEKHKSLPKSACVTTSSKGWVTLVDSRDGALYLWDPLSEVQKDVLRLPSAGTLPCVVDIGFGGPKYGPPSTTIRDFTVDNLGGRQKISCFDQIKLWMMMTNGSFSTSPDDVNHCIAMGYHGSHCSLHYSEIGGTEWKALDSPLPDYTQILASAKKDKLFFALSGCGEIEAWDLSDLSNIKRILVTEVPHFLSHDVCCKETDLSGKTYKKKEIEYIVESFGELLIVTRYIAHYNRPGYYRTIGFVVRRLNFRLSKLETVNCLGNYAIFVGTGGECFSLRACEYSGLQENAIYFAPADKFSHHRGRDAGVFYMADSKIDRYKLTGYKSPQGPSSYTPSPFWVAPPTIRALAAVVE